MGRLIASHKNVEYAFDPPLLHRLIYFTNILSREDWRALFESYLNSDIFMGAIAGRNLNFNRYDLSYVLHHKTQEEITARLERVARREILAEEAKSHTLCLKVTDALLQIEYIKSLYPGMRFIAMCRNANDTIRSVVKQGWFSDANIAKSSGDSTLPMLVYHDVNVPLWVDDESKDSWVTATEVERAAMYYIRLTSVLLEKRHLAIIVNYDNFVKSPRSVSEKLREVLKLHEGEKTERVIGSVMRDRSHVADGLAELSDTLRDRAESIASELDAFAECPLVGSAALC